MVTGNQLLAHTLIPAQPPPLPVFFFLLPVVPPECMPKLQLSTAKSQKLMQEKETAICKKTTKNMFCGTLVKHWSFSTVFFVASICPQDITGCHVAISTNTQIHENSPKLEIRSCSSTSSAALIACSRAAFQHAARTIAQAQTRLLLNTSVPNKAKRCSPSTTSTSQYGTCT